MSLLACGGQETVERPDLGDVMPIIPLPLNYEPVSVTGSAEAVQLAFVSPVDRDQMVEFYRVTFTREPWTLISDAMSPDGSQVLYAEVDGTPLWVRILKTPGAPGSTIYLSGALISQDSSLIESVSQ